MTKRAKISTPEQLIAAALKLFAKKGYKATTIVDIARSARMNVSLVSYHFNGKAGLFRACIEQAASQRLAAARHILTKPQSSEEVRVRLTMFVEEMLNYQVENPEVCTILHRDLHTEMTLIKDLFENGLYKSFATLMDFIEDARGKGLLKSWVNPTYTASHLYGIVLHFGKHQDIGKELLGLSLEDPSVRKEIAEYAVKATLEGIHP